MIWVIADLIKNLFSCIIKIIDFTIENFGVLFFSFAILLSVAILKINYQPYSFLIIIIFIVFTIADFKKCAKEVAVLDTTLKQVLVLCFRMGITLFSIVFFYAMVKAGFMSGKERPASYVYQNFMSFIAPKLSSKHQFVDFMMILSYLLWVGCFSTCVCMQPKEKEKPILDKLFEDDINQTRLPSKVDVKKNQFSVKRGNRKGYLSR